MKHRIKISKEQKYFKPDIFVECPPCQMFAKDAKAPDIPARRTFTEEIRTQGPYTKEPVPGEAHCLIYGKGRKGQKRQLVAQVWSGDARSMMVAQHNADFIVKACNSHDDLVAALEKASLGLMAATSAANREGNDTAVAVYRKIGDIARAAIAKAKEIK